MDLKTLIKTDYQYFLLPFSYFAVWLAAAINYLHCGMPLKIIKITIVATLIWLIFIMLIPLYLDELLGWNFVNSTAFYLSSIYLVSIPTTRYLIKDQKKNDLL